VRAPTGQTALIERYRTHLSVGPATPVVTIGEGSTPLLPMARLGGRFGVELYAKFEGMNPTGSFKDRGMTVALSKAVEEGSKAVICASTGNTSASAAAYAARAGIRCAVVIPQGKIAAGKLAQALMHGATVLAVEGSFDTALRVVREIAERHRVTLVNSVNPDRLQGQKTAAFEICDELGDAPDALCIPVGNAGNVTAYWMGFKEYRELEMSRTLPRLHGFQAAGAAPLVLGHRVDAPETVATAIRIGDPVRGDEALAAMGESGGGVSSVTDEEILAAYREVAALEGIFCEPASAASIAGFLKAAAEGSFAAGSRVVCVLTGHGLKDPDTAIAASADVVRIPASTEAAEEALFG
jgi:threonine synthase